MWRILQQETPDDYVLATGETHSVRGFASRAFAAAGIELDWKGEGLAEKGVDAASGEIRVEIDPRYFRPAEVDLLMGDAAKARERLGWTHTRDLDSLVGEMVAADLELLGREGLPRAERMA